MCRQVSLVPKQILGLVLFGLSAMTTLGQSLGGFGSQTFRWEFPLPTGADLQSVAFGNGAFVAVGFGGAIITSRDGTNWMTADWKVPRTLNSVSGESGRRYRIESTTEIGSPATWETFTLVTPGPDGMAAQPIIALGSKRFYRAVSGAP